MGNTEAFQKVIDSEGRGKSGCTGSRKHVVRSSEIVSCCHRRKMA
jgi:hypothetical protein